VGGSRGIIQPCPISTATELIDESDELLVPRPLPREDDYDPRHQRLLSKDLYSAMGHAELVEIVLSRDAGIRALRSDIVKSKFKTSKLESSLVVAQTADPNDLFGITHRGQKERIFSLKGSFALAHRRNLGHTSTRDVGSSLLLDVSHQSVARFEIALHAAYMGACQSFQHDVIHLQQRSLPMNTTRRLVVYAVRGDATNSKVWHHSKLHGSNHQK
jgi:hypothetical protein